MASRRYRGEKGGLHPHYTTQRAAIVSPVVPLSLSLSSLFSLLSFFYFILFFPPPSLFSHFFPLFFSIRKCSRQHPTGREREFLSKSRCVHSLWFHGTQSIMVDNETSGGRKIVIRVVAIEERERDVPAGKLRLVSGA